MTCQTRISSPDTTIHLVHLVAGRHPASQALPYIAAQTFGAIAGAGVLYLIASGAAGFDVNAGFASNGFGEHSPGGYSMVAGFVSEAVLTFMS